MTGKSKFVFGVVLSAMNPNEMSYVVSVLSSLNIHPLIRVLNVLLRQFVLCFSMKE